METVCGFFSLHPWELPWDAESDHPGCAMFQKQLKEHLISQVVHQNATRFLVCMDGGAPLLTAKAILDMKQHYPITLECIIPFEELHVHWSERDRDQYFTILEQCDVEKMISRSFSLNCYRRCAQYMADQCSTLIILWNHKSNDAGDAVNIARRGGCQIHLLSPLEADLN